MTEPTTIADLPETSGIPNPDDVQAYISDVLGIDLRDDAIPPEIAADVRTAFRPHGERTAAAPLFRLDQPEDPKPVSPAAGEGFYDDEVGDQPSWCCMASLNPSADGFNGRWSVPSVPRGRLGVGRPRGGTESGAGRRVHRSRFTSRWACSS
jgi:hypothetical protein